MSSMSNKYPRGGLAVILLFVVALTFGCASDQKYAQKDPFFEKWSTLAETATGSSPAPVSVRKSAAAEEVARILGEAPVPAARKELPTRKVTLKMRQADIKAVLRSLAKIADQNVIVKNEIKGDVTVDFNQVPWDQAFNSVLGTQKLTYAWEGNIIRVITLEDVELDLKRKTQEQGIKWVEPLVTVVIPVNYAKTKDMKDNLETFLTRGKDDKPRGSVRIDEFSNSLIISAIREDITRMIPIIEKIDKPTRQIQIRANIVETTKEVARQLGIQWGGMYSTGFGSTSRTYITPGGNIPSVGAAPGPMTGAYTPLYGIGGISSQGYAVNFPISDAARTAAGGMGSLGLMIGTLGGNILDLQLNALQRDAKLNILSSPSITTLDNQKAYTENGEKVPYSTLDTSVTPPTRTVKFEDAVLRLEITPHVIDNNSLLMKVLVKKDEVDISRTVDGNPFIIKKQTETNLIVRDGETIVISGLTKQRMLGGDSGLPGLKDVPFLGWLFKSDDRAQKMEEVLIFITPKILQPFQVSAAAPAAVTPGAPAAPVQEAPAKVEITPGK